MLQQSCLCCCYHHVWPISLHDLLSTSKARQDDITLVIDSSRENLLMISPGAAVRIASVGGAAPDAAAACIGV